MKHWQEMVHILDRAAHLGRQGRPAALAVVTHIRGSAYRRPGAKLLIDGDGGFLGGVSGGCLEEDVREVSLGVLATGMTRVLHYQTGSDDSTLFGLGLGCEGAVELLVQRLEPPGVTEVGGIWLRVRALLDGDEPFALATLVEEGRPAGTLVVGAAGRLAGGLGEPGSEARALEAAVARLATAAPESGRSGVETVGSRRVFTDVLLPPPKLLVCGATDDARPTAAMAALAGFRVYIADHRPGYLTAGRFPEARRLFLMRPEDGAHELPSDRDSYAVVKTHSLARDTAWVRRFLATEIPYIGVLGPRTRVDKILGTLGVAASARVFGPVGLDIAADGPEQVGLSVVAELLGVRAGRTPRHLRDRREAIHG